MDDDTNWRDAVYPSTSVPGVNGNDISEDNLMMNCFYLSVCQVYDPELHRKLWGWSLHVRGKISRSTWDPLVV